jgi:hypothetical protein
LWTFHPAFTPEARSERATSDAHRSRSPAVYPTTVGWPVVPDDAWTRATRDCGTANIPNG